MLNNFYKTTTNLNGTINIMDLPEAFFDDNFDNSFLSQPIEIRFTPFNTNSYKEIVKSSVKSSFFKKIIKYASLPENWNGEGAEQIQQCVIETVLSISDPIFESGIEVIVRANPTRQGGILLSLSKDKKQPLLVNVFSTYIDLYFEKNEDVNFKKINLTDDRLFAQKVLNSVYEYIR